MPSRRVADEVKVLSVRVPLDVYERLVQEADKRGVTVAVLARERLTLPSVAECVDRVGERLTEALADAMPKRPVRKPDRLAPGEESFDAPHVCKFKPVTAGAFVGECACGKKGLV